ncbi:hypothetical protein ElyMa_002435700, partial [Elysia marginata]
MNIVFLFVLQTSITTSKPCWAIAAVDQGTLAVGYHWGDHGIDLIDSSGHILRQLSSDLRPYFMEVSPDQHLVMTLSDDDSIAKLKLADSTVVYRHN